MWEKLRPLASGLEESDTRKFGPVAARNSHNYLDRSACRRGGLLAESYWPDVRFISTGILCGFCHFAAHREESLMLQGKGPKVDAETVMHSQVPLERHCTIDPVGFFLSMRQCLSDAKS